MGLTYSREYDNEMKAWADNPGRHVIGFEFSLNVRQVDAATAWITSQVNTHPSPPVSSPAHDANAARFSYIFTRKNDFIPERDHPKPHYSASIRDNLTGEVLDLPSDDPVPRTPLAPRLGMF